MNKKLFSVFFLMLFLNSSFAYSLPLNSVSNESVPSGLDEIPSHPLQGLGDDEFNAVVIRLQETPLQDKPVDAKDSEIVPLACTLTSLTDSEVQKIKDDIRIPGIIVGDISTGVKSKDPESLDRTQAILTEQGSDVGSLVTIPSVKVTPGQYPFLNHAGKGAFSVGVLLDDTLRVAKCPDDVILAGKCAIDDKLLSLRNSGSGIKSNFVTASKSFFNEMIASKVAGNSLTPAQGASFNENYETSTVDGKEPLQIKQVTREAGNAIKNRIHSSDFTALMEANAPQGTISIYSMFDKYFNSIFSAEAVSSIAGPTLLNQAKNLMGKAHLRLGHYWPFELKNKTVFRNLEAKFSSPDSFLGTRRVEKIRLLKTKHPEIGDLHFDMVLGKGGSSGYALIKGGTFQDWLNRNMGKEGLIGKIKDPELKHEILEYAELVEGHMRTVQTIANQATQHADGVRSVTRKALEASEITQEEATRRINQATIEEAQSISKIMQTVDDTMDLDLPEYFMRKQE
ncbi:MAG: hypothetical protein Q7K42_03165, partial [Candidatus Diapherotrites archaeon]|nr:hypothetical protein [Candidatus Diapherotrites archaeon]